MSTFDIDKTNMPKEFLDIASQIKEEIETKDWFIGGRCHYLKEEDVMPISAKSNSIPTQRQWDALNIIERKDLEKENIVSELIRDLEIVCRNLSS